VNLWVKHDDEFPDAGGGNKVRKLQFIFAEAERSGCDAIVTTGGASSNHVRAAALLSARRGWLARVIIHDPEPAAWSANLRLARLAGAELTFCNHAALPSAMDAAMDELRGAGLCPCYIWGGGHTPAGGQAFRAAAFELADQCVERAVRPDFIVVASGTGTTQGGLHVGASVALPHTSVLGISVSHDRAGGMHRVQDTLRMLAAEGADRIEFHDEFLGGGYGRSDADQAETMRWAARTEALLLDPIYTGKAFHGLRRLVASGRIAPGSTIVFWHTGGLLNLLS